MTRHLRSLAHLQSTKCSFKLDMENAMLVHDQVRFVILRVQQHLQPHYAGALDWKVEEEVQSCTEFVLE